MKKYSLVTTRKSVPVVLLFTLWVFFCAEKVCADVKQPWYGRASNSQRISLNGKWQFRLDGDDKAIAGKRRGGDDEASWKSIDVPSAFNVAFKELWTYEGVVWYKRDLKLSGEHLAGGNRIFLRFMGASLRKKVWVNGTLVGEDISPYSPFEFDITGAVKKGDNLIVVRADTSRLRISVPDRNWNGWWNYGGIYRDVFVEIRPAVSIRYLWMTTEMNEKGWNLVATAELYIPGPIEESPGPVVFSLEDSEGKELWQGQAEARRGRVSVRAWLKDIKEWRPGSPVLYKLSAYVGNHEFTIRTAFREIETRGSKIYLNGKPIKLYGINYHEDHQVYGNAIPPDVMGKDLDDIREMGCNFLRTSHYTSAPYVFDYCDENGILVWTEIPAWQTSVESLTDADCWKSYISPQLTSMVREYRHHPCVVFWSVGNEFDSAQTGAADYVKRAVSFVKRLDDTRLVTFASSRRLKDQAAEYVDVISWNEYYGWYYGTIHDLGDVLDAGHAKWPDKPILISEFGAGGPIDRPTGGGEAIEGKQYTLQYQNRLIKTHLEQIYDPKRESYVAGAAVWCFSDFADPHRHGQGHPQQWYQVNTKGVVTRDRKRKPAFDLIKQFYLSEQDGND